MQHSNTTENYQENASDEVDDDDSAASRFSLTLRQRWESTWSVDVLVLRPAPGWSSASSIDLLSQGRSAGIAEIAGPVNLTKDMFAVNICYPDAFTSPRCRAAGL